MTNKYTPVEVHHPNITIMVEAEFATDIAGRIGIDSRLRPLIDKITKRRPDWKLRNTGMLDKRHVDIHPNKKEMVRSLIVRSRNGEELGGISLEGWGTDTKFVLSSRSIQEKRQRGNDSKTSKLPVALKIIDEHFVPMSDEEVYTELNRKLVNRLVSERNRAEFSRDRALEQLTPCLIGMLESNMEEYAPKLSAEYKVPEEVLRAIPGIHHRCESICALAKATSSLKSRGYIVADHDGKFLLDGKLVDTLPTEVAARHATLKLTEIGSIIEGFGVHISEGGTYVYPKPEPDAG
jgi:hypothetical protein